MVWWTGPAAPQSEHLNGDLESGCVQFNSPAVRCKSIVHHGGWQQGCGGFHAKEGVGYYMPILDRQMHRSFPVCGDHGGIVEDFLKVINALLLVEVGVHCTIVLMSDQT